MMPESWATCRPCRQHCISAAQHAADVVACYWMPCSRAQVGNELFQLPFQPDRRHILNLETILTKHFHLSLGLDNANDATLRELQCSCSEDLSELSPDFCEFCQGCMENRI